LEKLSQGFDGYSSNVIAFWDNIFKGILLIKNQPQRKFDHFFESAGPGCTFILTKKLAISLKEFIKLSSFSNLENYHDWLIYAYARSENFKWYIDAYPGVKYRQHSSNVFGANIGFKAFFSRFCRILSGEGFNFAIRLTKELKGDDKFIKSLVPLNRISLLRLALNARQCRRRLRDQILFFLACVILTIIFPKKLTTDR